MVKHPRWHKVAEWFHHVGEHLPHIVVDAAHWAHVFKAKWHFVTVVGG